MTPQTTTVAPANRIRDRRLFDRRLFLTAAIAFPTIVVAGFARTYCARGLFDGPPLPSVLVHAHALLMTGWVAPRPLRRSST